MKSLQTVRRGRGRRGIALVLVLGFLSLLVLSVVTYCVIMRTGRITAKRFSDGVRAREYAWVSLSRAQSSLDAGLGGTMYPGWSATNSGVAGTALAPAMYSDDATNFVPLSLQPATVAASDSVRWSNLTINDGLVANRLVGRYAYVVANCSGLLDVNWAGGNTNAATRNDPQVISLLNTTLPELTAGANQSLPFARSNTFQRFESVPDYVVCAKRSNCMSSTQFCRDTFVYSRAPGNAKDLISLTSDRSLDTIRAEAQAAFAAMGVPDPVFAARNLRDYIDEDFDPTDGEGIEPIPMMNELIFSNRFATVGGTNYVLTVRPAVELYFPFVGITNRETYTLTRLILQFANPLAPTVLPTTPGRPLGQYVAVNKPITVTNWSINNPFMTIILDPASATTTVTSVDVSQLTATIVAGEMRSGTKIVDGLPVGLRVKLDKAGGAAVDGSAWASGKACDDPRLNSELTMWNDVGGTTPDAVTFNSFNSKTTYANFVGGADGTNIAFIRNGYVSNVAELGYLMYSKTKPWQTLRLLNGVEPAYPVLDYFTVRTNDVAQGLLNPNTDNRYALAALLAGGSKRYEPLVPVSAADQITGAEALTLADFIKSKLSRSVNKRSDLAKITDNDAAWPASVPPALRESLLMNFAELVSHRQNMFTILLAAQSIDDSNGDGNVNEETEITGEQRAVAVVWRDPVRDSVTGAYEQRVVFFKWLTVKPSGAP